MKILYLGCNTGTSGHRAAAMMRLGHEVTTLDPDSMVPKNRWTSKWKRYTGGVGLTPIVRRRILERIEPRSFDVAWVDHGALVSGELVLDLKKRIPRVLCYNIDDPFGSRDKRLWGTFRKAVRHYDLLAVVRTPNVAEAYQYGSKRVMRLFMSADEIAHAPRPLSAADREAWKSEVVFVGTAFPERGPFLAELIRLGVPLSLYGDRYPLLREWPRLRAHWRGFAPDHPDEYAKAICSAKVCLGLLSKGNRDLHTTRSMEIPSLGGVFCAERTIEHAALYEEGKEALFWNSPEECAARCMALLADESWRRSIAAKGRERFLKNGWTNMRVIHDILEVAMDDSPASLERFHARLPLPEAVLVK